MLAPASRLNDKRNTFLWFRIFRANRECSKAAHYPLTRFALSLELLSFYLIYCA